MTLPKPPPLPVDLDLEPFQVAGPEEATQREGMLRDPRDLLISSLQRELHTLQLLQRQPISEPPPDPDIADTDIEPAPETRPSRAVLRKQRAVSISKALGKWSFLLGALPFVGAVVVKTWPQTAAPVDFVLQLLEQLK